MTIRNTKIKPDGTYIYRDDNVNALLTLNDQPIFDEGTNETIGYETTSVDDIET